MRPINYVLYLTLCFLLGTIPASGASEAFCAYQDVSLHPQNLNTFTQRRQKQWVIAFLPASYNSCKHKNILLARTRRIR